MQRSRRQFQDSKVGDWVPMFSKVNDTTAFKIVSIKPAEELVWFKPDSTWAWTLTDIGGRTRLVTRLRVPYRWHRPVDALMSLVLFECGDFPMMRKMLRALKHRAEAELRAKGPAAPNEPAGHLMPAILSKEPSRDHDPTRLHGRGPRSNRVSRSPIGAICSGTTSGLSEAKAGPA